MKHTGKHTFADFSVGPHSARPGWKTARINYDPSNAAHQRQVQAALGALIDAQLATERGTQQQHGELAVVR